MTVVAALRMRVPRRLANLLAVNVAVPMLRRMHVPGLLMNPLSVPLAMLVARGMHVPGPLMTRQTCHSR